MTSGEFQRLVLEEMKAIQAKVSRLDENIKIIEDVEAQLTETDALVKSLLRPPKNSMQNLMYLQMQYLLKMF